MIALGDARHAGARIDDDARPLVAEDGREQALGIGAREGELVRVADAGGLNLDQDLALAWARSSWTVLDCKWRSRLVCDRCSCFHHDLPRV